MVTMSALFVTITVTSIVAIVGTPHSDHVTLSHADISGSGSYHTSASASSTDDFRCERIIDLSSSTSASRCRCTSIGDILCNDVDRVLRTVPRFVFSAGGPMTYRSIHLDRQAISHLPRGAFHNISVSRIVLSSNPLADRIDQLAFDGLEATTDLELGACGLVSLPTDLLKGMGQLRRLHLWSNSISRIPAGFFLGADSLEELLLWNNQINKLDNLTLAGLWTLRQLDLDRNHIADLHREAFRHFLNLETLRIGENRIEALHGGTFSLMPKLRAMSLDRNRILYIHHLAFEALPRLISLDLTGNEISHLPDNVFSNLTSLIELRLSGNQLDYISTRTFVGLQSLRRLDLSGNKIADLPDGAFRHSPGLEHLILDENRLTTLRRCVTATSARQETGSGRGNHVKLTRASSLRVLSLVANPILCDCGMSWIMVPGAGRPASDWGGGRTFRVRGSCQVGETSAAFVYNRHRHNDHVTINHTLIPRSYSLIGRLTSSCTSMSVHSCDVT